MGGRWGRRPRRRGTPGEEQGRGRRAGGEAARGSHVRAGAGVGGCLQGPGGGEQAGLLYPPHPNSYQSGHRELSILPTPPPTLSHMNVLGTDSGQTCDSAHGTRKAPALSLGLETQVSRPRGGDQEAGLAPVWPQCMSPGGRCLQTHCRAQALGREARGPGPCFSGQPSSTPPQLRMLD